MKRKICSFVAFILIFLIACNRNADIVRQLHYVDLLSMENRGFHKYPNEFSTRLLQGILKENLNAYHIDYDSSGQIYQITQEEFLSRIIEPYESYTPGESTIADAYSHEDAEDLISSVTLLGFDHLNAGGSKITNYINFYHPGEITPEGINKYICSVEFEPAIEYLRSSRPQILWHNYKLADWGWYNDHLFIPQLATSTRLATDMITIPDSAFLATRISDSLSVKEVKELAENFPYFITSRLEVSDAGELQIIYKNDSVFYEIGRFRFDDIEKVAEEKNMEDSVVITPVSTAILSDRLKHKEQTIRISENGRFNRPLKGRDQISRRMPGRPDLNLIEFDPEQKFYFRTIERLLGKKDTILSQVPQLLVEGVRKGLINVFKSDSLKRVMQSGEFFNNMILDDMDNTLAKTEHLEVYQVITETVFYQNGKIDHHQPVGIGLFLPGRYVPEGLNRPIGYFKTNEVNEYLSSIEEKELPFSEFKGYPLKSWHVGIYREK